MPPPRATSTGRRRPEDGCFGRNASAPCRIRSRPRWAAPTPSRPMQLDPLATHLWHATHAFKANGLPITTRMTVVRLPENKLLIHSPIPMPPGSALLRQVQSLGSVAFIVAPNKMHHLFLAPGAAAFPQATVYGPQGLAKKRRSYPQATCPRGCRIWSTWRSRAFRRAMNPCGSTGLRPRSSLRICCSGWPATCPGPRGPMPR